MKGLILTITLLAAGCCNDTEAHQFRGSFERVGSRWRLHTATGYYDLTEGRHHSYVRDRLGSTVAVVDDRGRTEQLTAYYPSGVPYDLLGFGRVTDRLHIGNRWMAQSGFNTYDNTARRHYPLLPSFDVPDPLSQDYPSLSPYSHCAGNPLSLIDPTGERIVVSSAGTEYEYKETPEDGYCFVDSNGKYPIGTHSFLYDVETALNEIQQGKNGKEMVNYLINSDKKLYIQKSEINQADIQNFIIGYNNKSKEGGISFNGLFDWTINRDSYIGLAHELAHIEDVWKKTYDNSIWYVSHDNSSIFYKRYDIYNCEKFAIQRENEIRIENEIPIRTHYENISTHNGLIILNYGKIKFSYPSPYIIKRGK